MKAMRFSALSFSPMYTMDSPSILCLALNSWLTPSHTTATEDGDDDDDDGDDDHNKDDNNNADDDDDSGGGDDSDDEAASCKERRNNYRRKQQQRSTSTTTHPETPDVKDEILRLVLLPDVHHRHGLALSPLSGAQQLAHTKSHYCYRRQ